MGKQSGSNIGEKMILGHMPLIGSSYQSKEKDRELIRKFSDKNEIRKIFEAAYKQGIRKYATSSSKMSKLSTRHLNLIKEYHKKGYNFEVIPCFSIPIMLKNKRIDTFKRWATYLKIEKQKNPAILNRVLNDPILNFREGWRKKLPEATPYSRNDLKALKIKWDNVEDALNEFSNLPVSYVEPGSETDFLAMTERYDLLGELIDRITASGYEKILFGVHHAGETIIRLDKELEKFDGYLTPINSMGIMMLPTHKSAEDAIKNTKKEVFVIKPFAGGRIEPSQAFKYILKFKTEGIMFGASTEEEIVEDINAYANATQILI
jgi:hypothetical protein